MKPKELDLQYNDEPICPHCGAEQPDYWEHAMLDGETIKERCEACNEMINVRCNISIKYDTWSCDNRDEVDPV